MESSYYHANAFSLVKIERNLILKDPTVLESPTILENLTILEDPKFS